MTLNDGVAWGTIIGGVAGFLSFGFVLVDKFTKRPKLITSVRKATFSNQGGGIYDGPKRASYRISLEIGNVGSEATTITRVFLSFSDGRKLETKDHQNLSGGVTFIVDDYNTRVCEKGMAFVEHFKFYSEQFSEVGSIVEATLHIQLIGGREHLQHVLLEMEK